MFLAVYQQRSTAKFSDLYCIISF